MAQCVVLVGGGRSWAWTLDLGSAAGIDLHT